jgi:Aminotransferase class-V
VEQTRLYLDTARLGRMSPRAEQAHTDFARLAADEAGSFFFERFLRSGASDWPEAALPRYPELANWRGVAPLKPALRELTGSHPDLPVLLVNRSAQLMKLAALSFFGPCENVLATDLGWPPYNDVLAEESRRSGRQVTVAGLKDGVLRDGWSEDDVIRVIQDQFWQNKCDGLFLGAVSHLGVRLPAEQIVQRLEAACKLRFVVIDGAQEFCHVPTRLRTEYCDLYLAGCHKWLGGCHPMGLGFYGRYRSQETIETILGIHLASGAIDDPLLRFSTQLETGQMDGRTETVSLMPLFTGYGAVLDAIEGRAAGLPRRLANIPAVTSLAQSTNWEPVLPDETLRTGILML